MIGILSQYICTSNLCDEHFKYLTISIVNYISVKLKNDTNDLLKHFPFLWFREEFSYFTLMCNVGSCLEETLFYQVEKGFSVLKMDRGTEL